MAVAALAVPEMKVAKGYRYVWRYCAVSIKQRTGFWMCIFARHPSWTRERCVDGAL